MLLQADRIVVPEFGSQGKRRLNAKRRSNPAATRVRPHCATATRSDTKALSNSVGRNCSTISTAPATANGMPLRNWPMIQSQECFRAAADAKTERSGGHRSQAEMPRSTPAQPQMRWKRRAGFRSQRSRPIDRAVRPAWPSSAADRASIKSACTIQARNQTGRQRQQHADRHHDKGRVEIRNSLKLSAADGGNKPRADQQQNDKGAARSQINPQHRPVEIRGPAIAVDARFQREKAVDRPGLEAAIGDQNQIAGGIDDKPGSQKSLFQKCRKTGIRAICW